MLRTRVVAAVAPIAIVIGLLPAGAAAQAPPAPDLHRADGTFSCRSSVVRLANGDGSASLEPVVANKLDPPCEDDQNGVPMQQLGDNGSLTVVNATTNQEPNDLSSAPAQDGDKGESSADAANVFLTDGSGNSIQALLVHSQAAVTCTAGQPVLSASSTVVGLIANGEPTPLVLSDHMDIGPIHLNETILEDTDGDGVNDRITQRAVWLDGGDSGEIVAGEAQAGFSGNPCQNKGFVRIVKATNPAANPEDFPFSGDLGDFALDTDPASDTPESKTIEVEPGTYTEREGEVAGWALTGLECAPGEDLSAADTTPATRDTTTDLANRSVTAGVDSAELTTCTFTNEKAGTITIDKDSDPDDPTDFPFSSPQAAIGTFALDDDSDPETPTTRTFTVPNGVYQVTEGEVAGFNLTAISCNDPTGNSGGDVPTRTASITVDAGEDVSCTFDNFRIERPACPEGSQRNEAGQCVETRTECPAGTVRDQAGNCVSTDVHCPPGSTQNAAGQCVSNQVVREDVPRGGVVVPIEQVPGARDSLCSKPGFGELVAIIGTNGPDRITGTNRSDRIFAFGGRDRVSGGRGNDCVEGGSGNDNLDGSNGNDALIGDTGRDILNGGTGRDQLFGDAGNDKLTGGSGVDRLNGGDGRDKISAGLGNDIVDGGGGDDLIEGGQGGDRIKGGAGNDSINVAESGPRRDTVDCGPGRDTVRIDRSDRVRNCERVLVLRAPRRR